MPKWGLNPIVQAPVVNAKANAPAADRKGKNQTVQAAPVINPVNLSQILSDTSIPASAVADVPAPTSGTFFFSTRGQSLTHLIKGLLSGVEFQDSSAIQMACLGLIGHYGFESVYQSACYALWYQVMPFSTIRCKSNTNNL